MKSKFVSQGDSQKIMQDILQSKPLNNVMAGGRLKGNITLPRFFLHYQGRRPAGSANMTFNGLALG